jgi:flavin-dependent dehydrogenase
MHDVLIAGAGPAGLAAAIRSRQRGFGTLVLERSASVPDKACGEGLMPSGVRQLDDLGVRIPADQCARFGGIRYLQEDGTVLEARFANGTGIGIRRTILQQALRERALDSGAELRHAAVLGLRLRTDKVDLETTIGAIEARLVIGADGLHSAIRRAAGLEARAASGPRRFGVRRHFRLEPWTDLVEVHWTSGVEAYVTPVSPRSVNVAFLLDREASADLASLLSRFPRLSERIASAPADSETRGAGPLLQRVSGPFAQRLALVGDAAGYVDAITGQGLSLAFAAPALLFDVLPGDLSTDLRPALRAYAARLRPLWIAYALPARALVALSRRPALRRAAFRTAAAVPGSFRSIVRAIA